VVTAAAALILPLVTLERFSIGPFVIYTFTALMGIGVLVGFFLAVRRGAEWGIPRERVALFSLFMIVGAIIGARFGSVLYKPDLVRKVFTDPGEVFVHFHGIASFAVYAGGLVGALLFFLLKCRSIPGSLKFLDIEGFALPFSSFFGRLGCALVHDHPGRLSDGWLAVSFLDGSRYDLGLLEAIFLLLVSGVFLLLRRQRHRAGFFFILYCFTYAPFRFLLDRLREAPPQYFGITVDQYAAALTILAGIVTIYLSRSTHVRASTSEKIHGNPVRSLSKP
jgi:phosphatidylglycerol:prolipoprotein diacylglycerol transferase